MTKLMRNGKCQKSLIVEKQNAMVYSIKLDLPATGTNGTPVHHGSRGPTLSTLSTKYSTTMMLTPINLNRRRFSFALQMMLVGMIITPLMGPRAFKGRGVRETYTRH